MREGTENMGSGLENKIVVIAGGVGGLGREICMTFAKAGANVVIADINETEGLKIVDDIKQLSHKAIFFKMDVTNSSNVNEVFDKVANEYGSVDVLVNCAGITKRVAPLEFPEEDFDKIMAVNIKGTFLCCQAAGRYMAKHGGGKIVNIASVGGLVGLKNTVAYCTSKGAVVQMTKALALDLAQYKINVNAVAPALANTPIATPVMEDKATLDWFLSKIPLGRLCEPKDVAQAILFLSSPASDFITGHILSVDGGWVAE